MADLVRRDPVTVDPTEFFDRVLEDWTRLLPFRRPWAFGGRDLVTDDVIRVDEYQEDDTLVVRAELPGIDPDRDVEITVSDGVIHIRAERRLRVGRRPRPGAGAA